MWKNATINFWIPVLSVSWSYSLWQNKGPDEEKARDGQTGLENLGKNKIMIERHRWCPHSRRYLLCHQKVISLYNCL